jgi:hypothetical protein
MQSITAVKTRIASRPLTALPVRDKVVEAAPLGPPPLPPTSDYRVWDLSLSPQPEKNDEVGRQSPFPRHQWYYNPQYSEADRPELEVREMRRDVYPSDSQIVLLKKKNKQQMDKLKVFSRQTTDNCRVWHKSVKTYFWYEKTKFTVSAKKNDWLGGRLEGEALFWHQSHQECFEYPIIGILRCNMRRPSMTTV